MPHVTNTVEINAPVDEVWAVLGDLTATRDWLPGVVAASLDGSTRVCAMADGSTVAEQISDRSDERRSYRFRHLRTPLPVRELHGSFTVSAGPSDGATVTLDTTFEPLDGAAEAELTAMIEGAFGQSLASLRRWIEVRERWDA